MYVIRPPSGRYVIHPPRGWYVICAPSAQYVIRLHRKRFVHRCPFHRLGGPPPPLGRQEPSPCGRMTYCPAGRLHTVLRTDYIPRCRVDYIPPFGRITCRPPDGLHTALWADLETRTLKNITSVDKNHIAWYNKKERAKMPVKPQKNDRSHSDLT